MPKSPYVMSALSLICVLKILDSISVEELSEFLNRPDAVTDGAELCTLLNNYNMTNQYLERVYQALFYPRFSPCGFPAFIYS